MEWNVRLSDGDRFLWSECGRRSRPTGPTTRSSPTTPSETVSAFARHSTVSAGRSDATSAAATCPSTSRQATSGANARTAASPAGAPRPPPQPARRRDRDGKTVMAALDYRRLCDQLGRKPSLLLSRTAGASSTRAARRTPPSSKTPTSGRSWATASSRVGRHVFAMVQSLRNHAVEALAPDAFDVVVIDEVHHAAAPSYRAARAPSAYRTPGPNGDPRAHGRRGHHPLVRSPNAVELRLGRPSTTATSRRFSTSASTTTLTSPLSSGGAAAIAPRISSGSSPATTRVCGSTSARPDPARHSQMRARLLRVSRPRQVHGPSLHRTRPPSAAPGARPTARNAIRACDDSSRATSAASSASTFSVRASTCPRWTRCSSFVPPSPPPS